MNGGERGQQLGHCDQALVQRLVGRQLVAVVGAFPEATPAAAHVPVGEVVDEGWMARPRVVTS